MDAQPLITDFHGAVARDLLIYMAFLGVAMAGAVTAALMFGGRALWTFTVVMCLLGGGLAFAAQRYHASIPGRIAEDLSAYAADPDATADAFEARYGRAEAGARFLRLALIWGTLMTVSAFAIIFVPRPTVRGTGFAIVLLSATTLILDMAAFRRDLRYSAQWSQM